MKLLNFIIFLNISHLCICLSVAMSSIGDLQKVYMKDGDGNAYLIKQAVYEGKIVTQWSHLSDQTYILKKLHLLQHREADICLITYPKSGMMHEFGDSF